VLTLSGSLRQSSFNTALAHAAQVMAPHGMPIEVATLHGVPLYDDDLDVSEGIPAAVLKLKAQILDVDALLMVTPEYNNGVPGGKNGIDWLSRADMKAIFAKRPTGMIGASMGALVLRRPRSLGCPLSRCRALRCTAVTPCWCLVHNMRSMLKVSWWMSRFGKI